MTCPTAYALAVKATLERAFTNPHGETGNIAAAPEQTIDGVQHQKRDPYQIVSCRKPAPMRCGDAGRATQSTQIGAA